MKTIHERVKLEINTTKSMDRYLADRRIAVFDIETTGLYPVHDKLILSGILVKDPEEGSSGQAEVIQFFADTPSAEKEIIEATLEVLSEADVILTYNGRSFDIPFLEKRASRYKLQAALTASHLDLYDVLKWNSDLKSVIGSLSQKNIEKYMGFESSREDLISGYESIRLYNQYLIEPTPEREKAILLHNHDDIIQLYRILPVLKNTDLHKAMFRQGYVCGKDMQYTVTDCHVRKGELVIQGLQHRTPVDYISFPTEERPYRIEASSAAGNFCFAIPAEEVAPGIQVIDAQSIIGKDALSPLTRYPGFESGYLILRNESQINYMEINAFVIEWLKQVKLK